MVAFPVVAVKTIAEIAFSAIPLVERLIRGRGRGQEKKDAAREFIREELEKVTKTNPEALPDIQNFDWVEAIKNFGEIAPLVDDVIDAVVALMNKLSTYNLKDSGPQPVNVSRIQTP